MRVQFILSYLYNSEVVKQPKLTDFSPKTN